RVERPVRHLDAHHLVVTALALAVDAVVQAEDAEHVLVQLAVQIELELLLELLDVGCFCGIDGVSGEHWLPPYAVLRTLDLDKKASRAKRTQTLRPQRPVRKGRDRSRRRRGGA